MHLEKSGLRDIISNAKESSRSLFAPFVKPTLGNLDWVGMKTAKHWKLPQTTANLVLPYLTYLPQTTANYRKLPQT